jgi:MYXO-CTERM domain-containing protein
VLAKEIERTREDLAVTLDAIAEKVSPKRVAGRAREQITVAAQGAVATAKTRVAELTSGGGSHAALPSGETTSAPGGAPSGVRPEYVAGGALGLLLLLWARRRRKARRLPKISAKDLARVQAQARAYELAHAKAQARKKR